MHVPAATPRLHRLIFIPGIVLGAGLLAAYLLSVAWQAPFPRDVNGYALGRDFLNAWVYGREAWSGEAGRYYDIRLYNQHLAALTGWDYPAQQWSYAPHFMLVMAPFGLMPYLPALALWTALSLLALLVVVPVTADRRFAWPVLVLAPAGVFCWISGQASFLLLALLIGIWRNLDRRPLLAGMLLGLLTVKPQLGLLFPLMLVLTGRWRVVFAAAATTLALAGATALLWGVDLWRLYLTVGAPMQELVLSRPTNVSYAFMPTLYMNARLLGASSGLAYGLQVLAALAAAGAVAWTYRRPRDPLLSYAALMVAGLVATPYLMSYDLLVAVWAVLAVGGGAGRERIVYLLVTLLPLLTLMGGLAGIPGAALVLPALLVFLLRRLAGEAPAETAVRPLRAVSSPGAASG